MRERGMGGDLDVLVAEPESFFTGFTADQCQAMLEGIERQHLVAGATILRAGEVAELKVIVSGSAEVFLTDGAGTDRSLRVLGPGQSLGEMSLFTRDPATASARALTDLELLCIPPDQFHRMAAAFPQLYVNLGAI